MMRGYQGLPNTGNTPANRSLTVTVGYSVEKTEIPVIRLFRYVKILLSKGFNGIRRGTLELVPPCGC